MSVFMDYTKGEQANQMTNPDLEQLLELEATHPFGTEYDNLKDKINQALEKAKKYDDLMTANSEVVKKNIDMTQLYQNQHNDECKKALEFYNTFKLQNYAYGEAFDKLIEDSKKLQQAEQKLQKIESRIKLGITRMQSFNKAVDKKYKDYPLLDIREIIKELQSILKEGTN